MCVGYFGGGQILSKTTRHLREKNVAGSDGAQSSVRSRESWASKFKVVCQEIHVAPIAASSP